MDTKRLLADLSVVIARAPIRPESAPEMKGLINGLESLIQAAEKKLDTLLDRAQTS